MVNTPFLRTEGESAAGAPAGAGRVRVQGIDDQDKAGDSALHHSVREGSSREVIRGLIGGGANANLQNKKQDAPIHIADEKDRKDAVEELIVSGRTDLNLPNGAGVFLVFASIIDHDDHSPGFSSLLRSISVLCRSNPFDHRG